jgi:hypothetical protein
MSGRGHQRIPRTRIYMGCEGKSELAYLGLLRDIFEEAGILVHVEPDNLHPVGDPLRRVEAAVRRSAENERKHGQYDYRFVLLDHDQVDKDPQRAAQVEALAHRHEIRLIWQRPCHEAMLLRHLTGHQNDAPQSSMIAQNTLTNVWPTYRKPMEKRDLAKIIDLAAFRRAIAVECGLRHFAECIGFT